MPRSRNVCERAVKAVVEQLDVQPWMFDSRVEGHAEMHEVEEGLEDGRGDAIDRHLARRNAQHRNFAAVAHVLDHVAKRSRTP